MNSDPSTQLTIESWLRLSRSQLKQSGSLSAQLDAELLLAHDLAVTRTWLHAHGELKFNPSAVNKLLTRRLNHEPVAYLVGFKEFYGRDFIITPDVLIPRPETETMIELLITLVQKNKQSIGPQLLDVGTGSGCVGITARLELPETIVTASDVSLAALTIARRNAQRLGVKVDFVESDLLANFQRTISKFDFILANLPYVDHEWPRSLETDHEPALALFADDQGLGLIEKLIRQAPRYLTKNGYLLLEADPEQHPRIEAVGRQNGLQVETVRDYIVILRYV